MKAVMQALRDEMDSSSSDEDEETSEHDAEEPELDAEAVEGMTVVKLRNQGEGTGRSGGHHARLWWGSRSGGSDFEVGQNR